MAFSRLRFTAIGGGFTPVTQRAPHRQGSAFEMKDESGLPDPSDRRFVFLLMTFALKYIPQNQRCLPRCSLGEIPMRSFSDPVLLCPAPKSRTEGR
jgi:hypothetical protein